MPEPFDSRGAALRLRQPREVIAALRREAEPVALNRIVRAVERCAGVLDADEALGVATRTLSGVTTGTTAELDRLSIQTARS